MFLAHFDNMLKYILYMAGKSPLTDISQKAIKLCRPVKEAHQIYKESTILEFLRVHLYEVFFLKTINQE